MRANLPSRITEPQPVAKVLVGHLTLPAASQWAPPDCNPLPQLSTALNFSRSEPGTDAWQVLQEAVWSHQVTKQKAGCDDGALRLRCPPPAALLPYMTLSKSRPPERYAYHTACSLSAGWGKSPEGDQPHNPSCFLRWGKAPKGTHTADTAPDLQACCSNPGLHHDLRDQQVGALRWRILHFHLQWSAGSFISTSHSSIRTFILHFASFSATE